jgi:hypothetical protein
MRINRECWVGDSRIGDYEIAAGIVFRMYYRDPPIRRWQASPIFCEIEGPGMGDKMLRV